MDLGAAGLKVQPFPTHGKPVAIVSYRAEQDALKVLRETCDHPHGITFLQGPALCGKTTAVRTFLQSNNDQRAVAIIDGKGKNTTDLLSDMLRQFGYNIETSSANEVFGLVRIFAMQQATSSNAPLVILENTQALNPSALRALCELAELRVGRSSAVKMVLMSERSLTTMTEAKGMAPIAKRIIHDFHLRPMSAAETKHYVHTKLEAAGSDLPEFVFPAAVCEELHRASGGWPGILDRIALLALARAKTLPVAVLEVERPALPNGTWDEKELARAEQSEVVEPHAPQLIVTNNGSVLQDLTMEKARVLVGRSDHNDIAISSRFVSRHHALFVRHGAATFLMDLNSTNGTYVNAARVSNHVLIHEDVVTIGHHRIKFYDPYATSRGKLDGIEFADTAIMKTLQDMRNLLAQENTELLPATSEDLPTIGT